MYRVILAAPAGAVLLWLASAQAGGLDGIYGPTPLTAEPAAPPFQTTATADRRWPRSFAEQPPITPHSIYDDYKFGLAENRCLLCHGASTPPGMSDSTHAPKVSPAHLVLRNGVTSPEITPGHRFCGSCHVPQTEASLPVGNTFQATNREPR
jgi:cytochrome c-type protein NapB